MSVSEASDQLLQIIEKKMGEGIKEEDLAYNKDTLVVGLSRVGHDTQQILACPLKNMKETDLGSPLHSLIIPSKSLHPVEIDYLQLFSKEKLT